MANELGNAAMGIGGSLLGMIGQNSRAKKAQERSKELMGIQYENQRKLNQQGNELQMQMWKDTNFPAQMKMLKEAGLSEGLMYGQGGAGGTTTGSQGGGSAASGQSHAPMDIGSALQAGLMKANIDNLNSKTELNEKLGDTEGDKKTKVYEEGKGQWLDNIIKQFGMQTSGEGWAQSIKKNNKYGDATINSESVVMRKKYAEANNEEERNNVLKQSLENMKVQKTATEAGIELTKEQEREVYHKIMQGWAKTGLQVLDTVMLKQVIKDVLNKWRQNK